MDDDEMNWWSKESGRKLENLEETHAHSIYFDYSVLGIPHHFCNKYCKCHVSYLVNQAALHNGPVCSIEAQCHLWASARNLGSFCQYCYETVH